MNAGQLFATLTVNVFPVEPIVRELEALRIPHRQGHADPHDPLETCAVLRWERASLKLNAREALERYGHRPACDCGADQHNAKVEALVRKVQGKEA